jgi:high-affinity K+ transport system ATPase subunit B
MSADSTDLIQRAVRALLRDESGVFATRQVPTADHSRVIEHAGDCYVVLGNHTGTLAVFKRSAASVLLRRMQTWPAEVIEAAAGVTKASAA